MIRDTLQYRPTTTAEVWHVGRCTRRMVETAIAMLGDLMERSGSDEHPHDSLQPRWRLSS
jgi:hypothetical protein